jgi:hypothetical protein
MTGAEAMRRQAGMSSKELDQLAKDNPILHEGITRKAGEAKLTDAIPAETKPALQAREASAAAPREVAPQPNQQVRAPGDMGPVSTSGQYMNPLEATGGMNLNNRMILAEQPKQGTLPKNWRSVNDPAPPKPPADPMAGQVGAKAPDLPKPAKAAPAPQAAPAAAPQAAPTPAPQAAAAAGNAAQGSTPTNLAQNATERLKARNEAVAADQKAFAEANPPMQGPMPATAQQRLDMNTADMVRDQRYGYDLHGPKIVEPPAGSKGKGKVDFDHGALPGGGRDLEGYVNPLYPRRIGEKDMFTESVSKAKTGENAREMVTTGEMPKLTADQVKPAPRSYTQAVGNEAVQLPKKALESAKLNHSLSAKQADWEHKALEAAKPDNLFRHATIPLAKAAEATPGAIADAAGAVAKPIGQAARAVNEHVVQPAARAIDENVIKPAARAIDEHVVQPFTEKVGTGQDIKGMMSEMGESLNLAGSSQLAKAMEPVTEFPGKLAKTAGAAYGNAATRAAPYVNALATVGKSTTALATGAVGVGLATGTARVVSYLGSPEADDKTRNMPADQQHNEDQKVMQRHVGLPASQPQAVLGAIVGDADGANAMVGFGATGPMFKPETLINQLDPTKPMGVELWPSSAALNRSTPSLFGAQVNGAAGLQASPNASITQRAMVYPLGREFSNVDFAGLGTNGDVKGNYSFKYEPLTVQSETDVRLGDQRLRHRQEVGGSPTSKLGVAYNTSSGVSPLTPRTPASDLNFLIYNTPGTNSTFDPKAEDAVRAGAVKDALWNRDVGAALDLLQGGALPQPPAGQPAPAKPRRARRSGGGGPALPPRRGGRLPPVAPHREASLEPRRQPRRYRFRTIAEDRP